MSTLLKIDKLSAWYGDTRVLNEVDIEIKEGEIVALLGRNGMGKTTTLHSVCGIIEKVSGKYLAIRPRVQLQNLAKVYAALKSRTFVVPEDILALLLSSMRHRFHEMSKQEIEGMILESVSSIKLP